MSTVHLPEPLRAYVERALANAPEGAHGTHLDQRGEMRLQPDRPWMPFTAEQSIAADETRFLWHARVRMAPFVTAVVEDAFEGGHGRLDAKVWGVVPVAHGRGELIDRGEAQRYLAELPWCPFAFVHNHALRYTALGDDEVRVQFGDERCRVDLRFDAHGRVVGIGTLTRARGDVVQPWGALFEDYKDFGGIYAPSRGEVWWETPEGRFDYWRGELLALVPTGPQGEPL